MTTEHDRAKRWRPWQFSLRALLLLMLVVASYLGGWMSNEWKQQREFERAKQETQVQYQAAIEAFYAALSANPPAGPKGGE